MTRSVDYRWRLAELMAAAGMHNSTELVPLLRDRGITLSSSQVYRLVTGTPERVSLTVMSAICDVFACTPADLVTVTATDTRRSKTATSTGANVVDLSVRGRPKRARVIRDD